MKSEEINLRAHEYKKRALESKFTNIKHHALAPVSSFM